MAAMKTLRETLADLHDGEVLRVDNDGCLVLWDRDGEVEYNCGETLDDYGDHNLTEVECKRLGIVWFASERV